MTVERKEAKAGRRVAGVSTYPRTDSRVLADQYVEINVAPLSSHKCNATI
jgi:hypothetical protein